MSGESDDVLIAGARVVDGTGNPWRRGDVALRGDQISAITLPGRITPETAREVVAANGLIVCPGFIDIQSHSIVPFFTDRRSLSKVTQGVTTEIMGEAWTPAPFGGRRTVPLRETLRPLVGADFDEWRERVGTWRRFGDWLADLERRGVAVNVGSFIGGGTVREWGKGFAMGEATPAELAAMRTVTAEAMADGAFGLASALIYPPGAYVGTDELAAICEVVAAAGGVHITHVRSEEARLLEALDEAITIAERTGVATEIYHLKAAGAANWHMMPAAIGRINAARAAGLDITADMYPYVASGTGLSACLPPWAEADGRLMENLRDPATRARIRADMLHPTSAWEDLAGSGGPESVMPARLRRPAHRPYIGLRLSEIAAMRGQHWVDTILDLLAAEGHSVFSFFFSMSEENLRLQMRQPWISFATDAAGLDPATRGPEDRAHPRGFGAYPRVLGRYVRDEGILTLEDAVRKMTSAVAARLRLPDRGLLLPGMKADVVLFDPATITDHATFENPHQFSSGIRDVWVNGVRVLRDGIYTGAMPGEWVRPRA